MFLSLAPPQIPFPLITPRPFPRPTGPRVWVVIVVSFARPSSLGFVVRPPVFLFFNLLAAETLAPEVFVSFFDHADPKHLVALHSSNFSADGFLAPKGDVSVLPSPSICVSFFFLGF